MENVDTLITAALEKAYTPDLMGTAITYTPPGGPPVATTGIVSFGAGSETHGADAFGQVATVRIRAADVAEVVNGAAVAMGGRTWEVIYADPSPDGLEWIAEIHRR